MLLLHVVYTINSRRHAYVNNLRSKYKLVLNQKRTRKEWRHFCINTQKHTFYSILKCKWNILSLHYLILVNTTIFNPNPPKISIFLKDGIRIRTGYLNSLYVFWMDWQKSATPEVKGSQPLLNLQVLFCYQIFPLIFSIVFKMFEMRENLKRRISL